RPASRGDLDRLGAGDARRLAPRRGRAACGQPAHRDHGGRDEALPGQRPVRVPERAGPDGATRRARAARPLGQLAAGALHQPERPARFRVLAMNETGHVACVQAEPAILDRAATLDRLAALTADAKSEGAQLVVFPETFVPAYPSSAWAKFLAGWTDPRA